MAEPREPSHPPSDPHPVLARASLFLGGEERPVRLQLVAALLLGLVLVATGLYLWRRPKATADASGTEGAPAGSAAASADPGVVTAPPAAVGAAATGAAANGPVSLSDTRVLACHDKGSKKTAPDQCDHVAQVEQALTSAITQAATCVPAAQGGGTIEYVADVSFSRHKVSLSLPKAGRSVRDLKVLRACSSAVRGALQAVPLDAVDHQHARYKIAVTATYRGSAAPGG
jgi:hypothetical protein